MLRYILSFLYPSRFISIPCFVCFAKTFPEFSLRMFKNSELVLLRIDSFPFFGI